MRVLFFRSLSLLGLLLTGCNSHPATQVIVLFHAEAALRAEATSIHVVVTGPDGSMVFDADNPVGSGAASSLARVPLVPAGGDASRTFAVSAELLDATGATLATVLAVSGYERNELRELHLWFDDACRDADCGSGRTCDRGVCVGACFDPSPVGEANRSVPTCSECAECLGKVCSAVADGAPCGCPDTDRCNAGACTTTTPVAYAAGGHLHTCAALRTDDLYCWGSNRVGQLGSLGGATSSPRLVELGGLAEGAAATDHTCWLDFSGGRTCWGWNGNAQMGLGTIEDTRYETPTDGLPTDPRYFSIDTGWYHTCGLSNDGRLLCWGSNEAGQCGQEPAPDPAVVTEPTPVDAASDWMAVSAGGLHSCGIKRDGSLYCWGLNASGELGVGDNENRSAPTRSACDGSTCFDDWRAVAAGDFHTCALRESGELWCWGGGLNGQLGVGATMERDSPVALRVDAPPGRYRAIAGGSSHTCALAEDETLWCWGRNDHGQLGTGDLERRTVPTQVRTPGGDSWIGLGLGRDHTCAVRADETLWCWGWNEDGQLGQGFASAPDALALTSPTHVCFP